MPDGIDISDITGIAPPFTGSGGVPVIPSLPFSAEVSIKPSIRAGQLLNGQYFGGVSLKCSMDGQTQTKPAMVGAINIDAGA